MITPSQHFNSFIYIQFTFTSLLLLTIWSLPGCSNVSENNNPLQTDPLSVPPPPPSLQNASEDLPKPEPPGNPRTTESVILEIIVNGQNQGQQFVKLTADDDVLISPDLLKSFRFRETLWATHTGKTISLRYLSSNVQFTIDRQRATLHLAVPPQWFEHQRIQREVPPTPPAQKTPVRPEPIAGLLNYKLQTNVDKRNGFESLELPWEMGVNVGQWFASSTFNSNYDFDADFQTHRLLTHLTWDDPDNLYTLRLGDFTAPATLFSGGGIFGGISLRKNFGLNRQFKYYPDQDLQTVIETPTHAELYSNGRRVKDWDLSPGEVTFSDLASYAGSDAELVLTDAFDRKQYLKVPSYTSQQLLKTGLHEYNYGIGLARQHLGKTSRDYKKLRVMGWHRYGVTNRFTGGLAFTAQAEGATAETTFSTLVGDNSQFEGGLLVNHFEDQPVGYATTMRYNFRNKDWLVFLGLSAFSKDYTEVSQDPVTVNNTSRYRGNLTVSHTSSQWGNVSLSFTENRLWKEDLASPQTQQLSFTYRKQFHAGWHVSVGGRTNLEDATDKEVFLTLQYLPKMDQSAKNYYDNLSSRLAWQKEERPEIEFNFQKTFPRGMGYGYVATLTEQNENLKSNMSAQYKNEQGVYTVNANGDTQGHLRGSFSVAGGIGVLGGQAYFGRPITDSFAVVRVRGLSEVPIKQGDSLLGKTNAAGNLLVAELNSYSQNLLSLGADNLPVNYVLGQADKSVEVKQRSGSLVTFEFTKLTAIEGYLYLQTAPMEKKRGELEVLPVEVTLMDGQKRDSFLGQKGYFYLENLPVGTHSLRVRRFRGDCVVRLTVPETDKVVVNFGEVGCLLEKGN